MLFYALITSSAIILAGLYLDNILKMNVHLQLLTAQYNSSSPNIQPQLQIKFTDLYAHSSLLSPTQNTLSSVKIVQLFHDECHNNAPVAVNVMHIQTPASGTVPEES